MKEYKSFYKQVGGNEGDKCKYSTRLDTYGCGCAHPDHCHDKLSQEYEFASRPSDRIHAIEKLQSLGYDVSLRLSPFIPEYIDYDRLNAVKCDKILVEFLRVNSWIKKWFDIDYSEYTVKAHGYLHLPLDWKTHVNQNEDDCCNLRRF